MKKTIGLILVLSASPALASSDMSSAEFFARDKESNWTGTLRGDFGPSETVAMTAPSSEKKRAVAKIVARQAANRLGSKWVPTALKLAKIESSYNCGAIGPRTRHGRAVGTLQVLPKSAVALGYDPRRLRECEYGIAAGVAHMEKCLAAGVETHRQMAACHVAGWAGWNRRLARRSENYKQHYIRLASR